MKFDEVYSLPVSPEIALKTAINTIKKFSHTQRALMYGRTPVELLDNIYMGDIAKNALLDFLRLNCSTPVIDYDDLRTDHFTLPDPGWDFKVGNAAIKVEIKSSTPPNKENREAIINLRDIKITASHDKGKTWIDPASLESEIHVQIYFEARPYKNGFDSIEALQKALNENPSSITEIINAGKYNNPLFFGWNFKEKIMHYANTLAPPTWSFSWTNRIYWRCPIKEALTLPQLIDFINAH